jgi:hypothetical protein
MGKLANNQTFRGADASIRLFKNGAPLDIIEAEEVTGGPNLKTIESEPLSVGHTQRDTHADGYKVTCKGIRKGNDFLQEIMGQVKRNVTTGKAFEHYTVVINYIDRNTNTFQSLKVADASLTEIDEFASGKNFDKQSEGFTVIGQLG